MNRTLTRKSTAKSILRSTLKRAQTVPVARVISSGALSLLGGLSPGTHCALCARAGQPGVDLCDSCQQHFKASRHHFRCGQASRLCVGCGQEVPLDSVHFDEPVGKICQSAEFFCSSCRHKNSPVFSYIVAPYRYAFPLDRLIKRVKYAGDRQLTRVLGHLLATAVGRGACDRDIDMLIPMPLHHSRLAERGFNQAQDIAHWCGSVLGIAVNAQMVQRIEATGSLAGLNRQERSLRILGVFRASESVAGFRVAIVDDVMTTGASAAELARELYDSGALSVELWVLARTSSVREGV